MDDEIAPLKAKNFVIGGLKEGRPKKIRKEVVEKEMVAKGLRRTDAQDLSVWGLDIKNWLTLARRENKPCSRRIKIFNNPGTNG